MPTRFYKENKVIIENVPTSPFSGGVKKGVTAENIKNCFPFKIQSVAEIGAHNQIFKCKQHILLSTPKATKIIYLGKQLC